MSDNYYKSKQVIDCDDDLRDIRNRKLSLCLYGTSCPMQLDEISVFENNNKNIGVNVWVSEYDEEAIKPMYSSQKKNPDHMVRLNQRSSPGLPGCP